MHQTKKQQQFVPHNRKNYSVLSHKTPKLEWEIAMRITQNRETAFDCLKTKVKKYGKTKLP